MLAAAVAAAALIACARAGTTTLGSGFSLSYTHTGSQIDFVAAYTSSTPVW
jgi:hypothetical protein